MAINIGDVVLVKTSGEPCFVLDVQDSPKEFSRNFSGKEAYVRLPVITTGGGIEHTERYFLVEELESTTEKFEREYKENMRLKELMTKATEAVKPKLAFSN